MLNLQRKEIKKSPELQISPMIDMIFLLLVFFILSTMYMTQVKTVPLQLPTAENSVNQKKTNYTISIKADNSLWLDEKTITLGNLVKIMQDEATKNTNIAIVIRADKHTSYGHIMEVLDGLKGAGVTKFALATEGVK